MMLHIYQVHLKRGTCSGPGPWYGQFIYFRLLYDLYNLDDHLAFKDNRQLRHECQSICCDKSNLLFIIPRHSLYSEGTYGLHWFPGCNPYSSLGTSSQIFKWPNCHSHKLRHYQVHGSSSVQESYESLAFSHNPFYGLFTNPSTYSVFTEVGSLYNVAINFVCPTLFFFGGTFPPFCGPPCSFKYFWNSSLFGQSWEKWPIYPHV